MRFFVRSLHIRLAAMALWGVWPWLTSVTVLLLVGLLAQGAERVTPRVADSLAAGAGCVFHDSTIRLRSTGPAGRDEAARKTTCQYTCGLPGHVRCEFGGLVGVRAEVHCLEIDWPLESSFGRL